MNKTVKYILIAVAVIAVIAFAIWGIKSYLDSRVPTTAPPAGPPYPTTGNTITDILAGLFSGGFFTSLFAGNKCNPNNPGFQNNGVYNPDKCGRAPGLGCDPNRPGWNLGGFMDPSCP